jgi:hypothetical protein
MVRSEKETAKGGPHPIFRYLREFMRSRDILECISSDQKRKIKISRTTQPNPDPTKKCFNRIEVEVISFGGRIESFRQNFYFYYIQKHWQVRTSGLVSVNSALNPKGHRVWTFHYSALDAFPADDSHIWLKEELADLQELIRGAEPYHSHHGQEPSLSPLG